MARRTPEEKAKRERLTAFLQETGVTSMADIQELFQTMVGTFLGNDLEGELDEK